MSNKRILVTGAAGFIGYHLCQHLQTLENFVVGVDNFNDYYPSKLKHDRANELKKKLIQIIHDDILNTETLIEIVERHKITHVVHLAAQAGVRYSLVNPGAYVSANINGFLSILELCRKYPHLFLTYASSSSVYGNTKKIPFALDDRTDQQASFYGVTKKTNELMAYTYHQLYNIPITGLRFFTVYGPWGRPDMAYFSFTRSILQKIPINIYNYGKMSRDFTYIDDIIDGIVAAINLESSFELFNLGNNKPESLSSLIEILEEKLGQKAMKNFLPMQSGDVEMTYADISCSTQKLGFLPKTSLTQGLSQFIDWYLAYWV